MKWADTKASRESLCRWNQSHFLLSLSNNLTLATLPESAWECNSSSDLPDLFVQSKKMKFKQLRINKKEVISWYMDILRSQMMIRNERHWLHSHMHTEWSQIQSGLKEEYYEQKKAFEKTADSPLFWEWRDEFCVRAKGIGCAPRTRSSCIENIVYCKKGRTTQLILDCLHTFWWSRRWTQ